MRSWIRRRHLRPARDGPSALPLLAAGLVLATTLPGCALLPRQDRHGELALQEGQLVLGTWLGTWPSDQDPALDRFSRQAGFEPDLVDVYLDWSTPYANVSHTVAHIAARGAVPILTWEAQGLTTVDIVDGDGTLSLRDGRRLTLDDYLDEFSKGACRSTETADTMVLVRVLHEANGHWFRWGISWQDEQGNRPNTPETYRAAWAKIHDAFSSRCGDSIRFVWATNHFSLGEGTSYMGAYPGDEWVDYVGIDGYNWGANADWGWQGVDDIFGPAYCAVVAATDKPVFIAETASSESGGDKAAWIRDLFGFVHGRGLHGLVWFNDAKHEVEIGGPMDWPLQSSPEALAAYREGAENVLVQRADGLTPVAARGQGC